MISEWSNYILKYIQIVNSYFNINNCIWINNLALVSIRDFFQKH